MYTYNCEINNTFPEKIHSTHVIWSKNGKLNVLYMHIFIDSFLSIVNHAWWEMGVELHGAQACMSWKAKRQYLLTFKVSNYYNLALQSSRYVVYYLFIMSVDIFDQTTQYENRVFICHQSMELFFTAVDLVCEQCLPLLIPIVILTFIPLDTTIFVFDPFYQPFNMFNSQLLGTKWVFKHHDLQMFYL